MDKRNEFMAIPSSEHQFPPAPPSYDDAVLKQPAYNPYMDQARGYSQMQAAPQPQIQVPMQPQPVISAVMYPTQQHQPIAVGPKAANMICPNCREQVKTNTTSECQKSAHVCALLCCIFGCWVCCCIPYCMSSFRNVHHKCPNCSAFLGTYKG